MDKHLLYLGPVKGLSYIPDTEDKPKDQIFITSKLTLCV